MKAKESMSTGQMRPLSHGSWTLWSSQELFKFTETVGVHKEGKSSLLSSDGNLTTCMEGQSVTGETVSGKQTAWIDPNLLVWPFGFLQDVVSL